ncbi:MAG: type III-A CRISPR-associated protein Cas10/Csm1 [Anaerolineae bacterium]|nr:type III-A CRISPR-associated protein Cas10/Csm1 [Anaerolineae bacterium]
MEDKTLAAALAGLLHDIGKFAQRAGENGKHAEAGAKVFVQKGWQEIFPRAYWEDLADAVASHHLDTAKPNWKETKRIVKITCLADRLSAQERRTGDEQQSKSQEAPLQAILAHLVLDEEQEKGEKRGFELKPLCHERETLFPVEKPQSVNDVGYQELWKQFAEEMKTLKDNAEKSSAEGEALFVSLLALLRKYTWCIASATPWESKPGERTLPDVSLYGHLKAASAIAVCLERAFTDDELDQMLALREKLEDWKQPVAFLVKGDFSGIQNFIYQITRPEAEASFEHVAKRLRGRSFFLNLLGEVLTDYLLRCLGLPAVNVVYLGGGGFNLLVPKDASTLEKLDAAYRNIERWLLEQFHGALSLSIAKEEICAADFADLRRAFEAQNEQLQKEKSRKWARAILDEDFYLPNETQYHVCRICHLTPLSDAGTCSLCSMHAQLGKKLPHATSLAFVYGDLSSPKGTRIDQFAKDFGVTVLLLDEEEKQALLSQLRGLKNPCRVDIFSVNNTDFLIQGAPSTLGMGYRFFANAAPLAKTRFVEAGMEPVEEGDVLHFEALAKAASGAKRIGVLRADVDRLGLLFSEGLRDDRKNLTPTLSRVLALSESVDLFFGGYLNELCRDAAQEWAQRLTDDEQKRIVDKMDGVFYILYSGGDDLFIVGPWDAALRLALLLQERWEEYACGNPCVTISAGLVFVKPHYPVQRFAEEAKGALEAAKDAGRNRIGVFSQEVLWRDGSVSFESLLQLGDELKDAVENNELPRGLVHDLERLDRQRRISAARSRRANPMWTPRFYYTFTRRVKKQTRDHLMKSILEAITALRIPISFVSLITRKE